MSETFKSPRHEKLRLLLIEKRRLARMTQTDLAKKMRRTQSFVSAIERGQRGVSVVEFLAFAEALGFDPRSAIRRVAAAPAA